MAGRGGQTRSGPYLNPDDGEDEGDDDLADRKYEGFHWGEPARRRKLVEVSPFPRELAEIGEVEAIAYRTKKGDTRGVWEHAFGENGGRKPILAVDPRADRLHIVGGDYRTTDRGIED